MIAVYLYDENLEAVPDSGRKIIADVNELAHAAAEGYYAAEDTQKQPYKKVLALRARRLAAVEAEREAWLDRRIAEGWDNVEATR